MEDDKKKKKNKKKKNRQTKTTGEGVGEPTNTDQNPVIEENHDNQVSGTADVDTDEAKNDVDLDRHNANGTEGSALAEAEKIYSMDREAFFEERIKKLHTENDIHIQKEASLEDTVKSLQKENLTYMQKLASLEKDFFQLQSEKDSWLHKEAGFEEKINQLIDETACLNLKGASLEEKIRQLERERVLWVQKENSMKETIASLNGDNSRLQIQVTEFEESRNYLLQENQRLTEIMSGMQYQIQNIEKSTDPGCTSTVTTMLAAGSEDMNVQMEAASQLVEQLVAENEELVEKVNELCVELDLQGVTAEVSPTVGSEPNFGERIAVSGERIDSPKHVLIKDVRNGEDVANAEDTIHAKDTDHVPDSMSEMSKTSPSGKKIESPEDVSRQNGEYVSAKGTSVIPNSPDTMDSEEIVQIPLDEKEVGAAVSLPIHDDHKTDVPLTDAPLIGAPFRFISFMARYVSGADLVNKS